MTARRRGPLLDEAAEVLREIKAFGEPDLPSMTPEQARESRARRPAVGVTPVAEIDEIEIEGITTRIYRPVVDDAPALVWLHGGGWVMGGWYTHDELFRALAVGTGCHVIAPDYRLAPEHPFPAAPRDVAAVLGSVAARAEQIGIDPSRISLGGDSAGANLAVVAALDAPHVALRSLALAYPAADCRFGTASFAEDHSDSYLTPAWMHWFRDHYLTSPDQIHDWRVSPVLAPAHRLASLPPCFVLVASHDPLRDEGLDLAARITDAGGMATAVVGQGLPHGFLGFARRSPRSAELLAELCRFVAVASA